MVFTIIDGGREKLEQQLLKEVFRPTSTPGSTHEILQRLKPQGRLTLMAHDGEDPSGDMNHADR